MVFCEKCDQQIIGKYVFNQDKPELKDKKFCSKVCMEQYYNENKSSSESGGNSSSSNFNWKDYQGWIIGGVIILVVIIILGLIFGNKKKK